MNINLIPSTLLDDIKSNLPTPKSNDPYLIITDLSVNTIEKILSKFMNDDSFYIDNFNGHDMDWSIDPININGFEYEVWGCATSGSLCFQVKK